MHVIWHQHIAADGHVVLLGAKTKGAKCFVNFRAREQRQALAGVEGHEVKRVDAPWIGSSLGFCNIGSDSVAAVRSGVGRRCHWNNVLCWG